VSRTWKNAALGTGVFLLGSLAWLGITGGIREIPQSTTTGQKIQAWTAWRPWSGERAIWSSGSSAPRSPFCWDGVS
jgi:hypothetical protein